MIKKIFPTSEAKLRILKIILKEPEINFSEIVKEAKTSPNIVLSYVNELVENNVIAEKRLGGKKKTHIRLFKPHFSDLGIDIFSFVEIEEKNKFLEKYKNLKQIVAQLSELFMTAKVDFCLIYGSFARFAADKESDLDLWLVGKIDSRIKERIREVFSTLDREYTMTIEDKKQFLEKINDSIHQNIINGHIVIYGEKEFLKILGKNQ